MWENVTENKARLSGSGFKITKCNKIGLISITKCHKDLNSNNLMIPTLITNSMLNCQRNLWTTDHQAPLSMGFSRHEYWSGLPCPPPGHLPDPGIQLFLLCLLHWQVGSLPLVSPRKPIISD